MLWPFLALLHVLPYVYGWYGSQTHPPYDPNEARMVSCPNYNLLKLGCHNGRDPSKPNLPRAVPEILMTTDSSSGKYIGYKRSTFPTYGDFLARFICDCAEKVRGKGYTHFSISNFFECWSGSNVANTYNLYNVADGCINGDKSHCDTHNVGLCAGTGGKHFVYTLKSPNPTGITTTALTTSISTQSTTLAPSSGLSLKCGKAIYKLRKLGCWNEREYSKAFPELLLTATDIYNQRLYAGYYLDTKNYETFLQRFVCSCASSASTKGYSMFGIRSYGQCWSGPNVACTYKKHGRANDCINQNKWLCSDSSSKLCASPHSKSVYAYVLSDSKDGTTCVTKPSTKPHTTTRVTSSPKTTPKVVTYPRTTPVHKTTPKVVTKPKTTPVHKGPPSVTCGNVRYKLVKLGCWSELGDSQPPRAMSELILTARDKTSKVYAGYDFNRHTYAPFLEKFVCHCINNIKQKGYSVFGLQFYGECWSGPRVGCTYQKFGHANGCVNQNMAQCSDDSTMLCSSDDHRATYVYVLDSTPVICPTNAPTQPQTTPKVTTTPPVITTQQTTPRVTTSTPKGPPVVQCGNVKYKLSKLGCWNELGDTRSPRAMPELLLTARDRHSHVYAKYDVDSYNYAAFLKRFICDCIKKVNEKGYLVFGLQFYGECWSGDRAGCSYEKFGKASGCVNENHARCSDDSTMLCSGNSPKHTYVYVPADTPDVPLCPTTIPTQPTTTPKVPTTTPIPIGPPIIKCGNVEYQLTKLGCWKDFGHIRPPRVLPELLLTAKDTTSSVYAGYKFYKEEYKHFIHKFTCQCVKKVKEKGYSVFGLQFYGECWSGPRAACDYKTFGKSYNCVDEKLGKCWDKNSLLCSGKNTEDMYVYIPADTPGGLTCPTTIPTTPTTLKITTPTVKITTPTDKITTPTVKITTPTDKITTPKPTIPIGPPIIKCGNVEYQLTKLGCWKDFGHIRPPRVLPELLLTAKDTTSSVYAGYKFYKEEYKHFIHKFTCQCVKKVKEKGYSVFGLQFYGECWSGPRAACDYKTFGKSYNCVDEKLGKCWDKNSLLCSGENTEDMYVYIPADTPGGLTCPTTIPTTPTTLKITTPTVKITTPTVKITTPTDKITTPTVKITTPKPTIPIGPPIIKCGNVEYQLTKLGCWKDFGHIRPPRVLPELLLTAKDTTSSVYAGYKFYKEEYKHFIHKFTCQCVKKVKEKGYSVFGLQFYGECWSGPRAACDYKTFGKSYNCVDEKLGKCWDKNSLLCSGKNTEDMYVYIPADTPGGLTCPTTIPTTPTDKMTTPTDKITTPTDKITTPTDKITTPTDKITTPTNKITTPTDKITTPTDKMTTPTDKITTPTDKITTPTDKITTPTTNKITPTGPPTIQCGNVEYKLTKLGCWKELGESMPPKAIPELLLTARDTTSSVYVGYGFEEDNFLHFIRRFACSCVEKVIKNRYSVFGLKFYGECWSGPQVPCTYKKFGQSNGCVNENIKQHCSDNSTQICSGHSKEQIYVYVPSNLPGGATCPTTSPVTTQPTPSVTPPTPSITPTTPTVKPGNPKIKCGKVEYELRKLGCWSERESTPRAIPELLLTARDSSSIVYAGYDIDTSNYARFLDRFICHCIAEVNTKGYSIFGLQFYGECWSGKRAECTYERYGQSNRCVNERKGTCSDRSTMLCSGDSPRNAYVYARADVGLPTCTPSSTISTVTTRSTPPAPTTALTVSPTASTTPRTTANTTPRTTPRTTPPVGFECKKALDIVIAIDASGSVMSLPFTRIRNFVSRLTRRFTSFKQTYFGLLHYNYRVIINTTLGDRISNTETLRDRIHGLKYLGQATLTQAALASAKTLFDNGARNDTDVQQILVLFTDGRTYGGKQTLRQPLQRLRQSGVRVTAVAIGNENYLDRYSLLLIAGNESNLVMIPSLDDLGQVEGYVDKAAYMVCPK